MAPGHQRQALVLGSGDQHHRPTEVDIGEGHIPFSGKAHHPVAGVFELFQGAIEVDHACHRQVFQGSGGHLGGGTGQASTAALGDHHAMGSHGFSGANNRPEVVGVGDTVQGHQQRGFPQIRAALDEAVEIKGFRRRRLQGDALVNGPTCDLSQPGPGHLFHENARGLGIAQELEEFGGTAHLRSAPDAMDGASGLQRGLGGMTPPDQIVRWRGGRCSLRGCIRPLRTSLIETGSGALGQLAPFIPRSDGGRRTDRCDRENVQALSVRFESPSGGRSDLGRRNGSGCRTALSGDHRNVLQFDHRIDQRRDHRNAPQTAP